MFWDALFCCCLFVCLSIQFLSINESLHVDLTHSAQEISILHCKGWNWVTLVYISFRKLHIPSFAPIPFLILLAVGSHGLSPYSSGALEDTQMEARSQLWTKKQFHLLWPNVISLKNCKMGQTVFIAEENMCFCLACASHSLGRVPYLCKTGSNQLMFGLLMGLYSCVNASACVTQTELNTFLLLIWWILFDSFLNIWDGNMHSCLAVTQDLLFCSVTHLNRIAPCGMNRSQMNWIMRMLSLQS